MSEEEIIRQTIDRLPDPEEIRARKAEGWRPVAIEWKRIGSASNASPESVAPPYGLTLRPDEARLEPSPGEERTLRMILRMVIDDRNSLADVASALNEEGLETRGGKPWSAVEVFHLLPRLVEVAPTIYKSGDWDRSGDRAFGQSEQLAAR